MCGIAGIVRWNGQTVLKDELIQMNGYLTERGPDHQGYWLKNNVGFAHSRLSIIDLSKQGNQPMSDTDKLIWITYNGEIYNFREIRKELEKKGTKFRSNSDTEVLIYGYLQWGIDSLLKKLNGMFAFAIWDSRTKEVILARDRFGQKPLYYYQNKNELLFSSDIRAIWSLKKSLLNIDLESLDYYLCELSTPQPKTIWKEIQQLHASHYMILNAKKTTIKKYWSLEYSEKIKISLEESIEESERLLNNAIKLRTVSDVPIAAFLSGGVDSGLICSLLASNSSKPIKTYTVGLKGFEHLNEANEALIVANKYNTDHQELIAEASLSKSLNKLIEYTGEPFADSSIIPSFLVCQAISSDVKVALSGDGGDEFFGGYYEYVWAYHADLINQGKEQLESFKNLYYKTTNKLRLTKSTFPIYHSFAKQNNGSRLHRMMGFYGEKKSNIFPSSNSYSESYLNDKWHQMDCNNIYDTLTKASLETRLINDYLVKVDRSSMINSLEVRSPFLDNELATFSAQIPSSYKHKNGHSKYILKSLAKKYFDPNIFNRPKKGFGVPINSWIKFELKDEIISCLFETNSLDDFFDLKEIQKILKEHLDNTADHTHRIWALYCFAKWKKIFL